MSALQVVDDTTSYLDEPQAGRLTIAYSPDADSEIVENPPRFTWLPDVDSDARYVLNVAATPDFAEPAAQLFANIPANFFTPDRCFEPGRYYWRYALWSAEANAPASNWSKVREVTIGDGLPEVPLGARSARYANADMARPRLWLGKAGLAAFSEKVAKDPSHCGWSHFHEHSVLPWLERELIAEPAPYPNNIRVADIWRQTYITCQETIYAIRHLAIAGHVLKDQRLLDEGKRWLLSVAAWDVRGTTSRVYNDEAAFRIATALAWGYDWLHDQLSDDERATVRAALLTRTEEIAEHVISNAQIHLFPYDSHAVRALSAALMPACIALLDEDPRVRDWLDYTIEFLFTVYSPWGDNDGGWAEGPHYWMTGMAYLIEAANLLKSFTGLDLYARPFFHHTGDFPLYTKAPDTRRCCFGDDATLGRLPSLKVGYNLRQFAGVTGNGYYQWYFDEIKQSQAGTEGEFYNYGWWDLNFDEMVYQHDFPQIEAVPPKDLPRLKWFKGIGWAAIQVREDDPNQHIQFLMKSSPYGSISHSHGDQNAFLLSAFGEDLAIQSGYYVAFHSSMHRDWRRQTRSKNALLIDGHGQYAGTDKTLAIKASGEITAAEEREDHIYMRGDATAAYAVVNPDITGCTREVYFAHDTYFVIVDTIDAKKPVTVDWLLHAHGEARLGANTFRHTGEKAGLYGQFVWCSGAKPSLSQEHGFPGVDEADYAGLDKSWHVKAHFAEAHRHSIATLIVPYPAEQPRRIFHFIDDQGFSANLYFVGPDEKSFKVVIPKTFDAGDAGK